MCGLMLMLDVGEFLEKQVKLDLLKNIMRLLQGEQYPFLKFQLLITFSFLGLDQIAYFCGTFLMD